MRTIKLSDYTEPARRVISHNMATIHVGDRVRYIGDNEWTRSKGIRHRAGTVIKKIKSRLAIRIRWDEPIGPADYDKEFDAHAYNVEPIQ